MTINSKFKSGSLRYLATIVCSCVVAWAGPSLADQNDPRLPDLFSDLANAPDPNTAGGIEREIWAIWMEAPDPQVNEWLEQARDAASSGAIETALELFERITSAYPGYAEGWNQRAILHFLMGDFESSLSDISRTLELEPRHFGALAGSGQCYLHLELFRESLIAFEAALQVNPWLSAARHQVEMLRALLKEQQTPI